jgi:drug/metabolite transporter (DMT)-like permease
MALVGTYVGLSKLLLATFPVLLLAWLRFAIAAVAMASWTRRRGHEPRLSSEERWWLFACAFFGNFLFSWLMLFGIERSTALGAGVVMSALPAIVALLSWFFLRDSLSRHGVAATACAAAGMLLLALAEPENGHHTSRQAGWGVALLLGAVVCEAAYVVIGKRLTTGVTPRRISALINLWGLALATPAGLWLALDFDFGAVPARAWGLLVFYALAASMVAVWLWMTGLKHVPAATSGVFTIFLPLSAAGIGTFVLGERLTGLQAVAVALAIAAVMLATARGSTESR